MADSLYVHIPFCKAICRYCDFPKVLYAQDWAFSYVDKLLEELERYPGPYKTIFVGGGTPTCLPLPLLERILRALASRLEEDYEFSIESNPDLLDDAMLSLLHEGGVNRLSIGGQTSSSSFLSFLGRTHRFEDVEQAVARAREHGFENINVDMMFAFPGQKKEDVMADLQRFLSLNSEHLSLYPLQIEEGTVFGNEGLEEENDLAGEVYPLIREAMREAGYHHYEVSNYAKPGYECRHNLTYWRDEEYDAIGLGAAGYRDGVRYKNALSLSTYLRDERIRAEEERVTLEDDRHYYLMTNLRLAEGFSLKDYHRRFGHSFEEECASGLEKARKEGLLAIADGRAFLPEEKLYLLDRLLLLLF